MKKILLSLIVMVFAWDSYAQTVPFDSLNSNVGYDNPLIFNMNKGAGHAVKGYKITTANDKLLFQSESAFSLVGDYEWYTRMTLKNNRLGIGTENPASLLDVNGEIISKELTVDPNDGYNGSLLSMGQRYTNGFRQFNFGVNNDYVGYSVLSSTGISDPGSPITRMQFSATNTATFIGIKDVSGNEIFKAARSPGLGSFIHLPKSDSRLVIGDFGSYLEAEGHKLVVKNGTAKIEGDIYTNENIGIGTLNPLNRLQIGNSMSFHDGGHEVIGFGYAAGSNTDLNNSEYSSEIRANGASGKLSFGIATSTSSNPTTIITVQRNGRVGIGTINPDQALTVKGRIHAEEVIVDLSVPSPDFVFQKYYEGSSSLKSDYQMPTLEEVEAFTKENHHLPEIPSADQIAEEGMHLKEMTTLLLQKIEELTLYTIEQEKRIDKLEKQIGEQ